MAFKKGDRVRLNPDEDYSSVLERFPGAMGILTHKHLGGNGKDLWHAISEPQKLCMLVNGGCRLCGQCGGYFWEKEIEIEP